MSLAFLALLVQVAIPPPRGYVNDFAGVLDPASIAHMEAVIAEVRTKTRGEIAVVTLPAIGDRPASEVALQIGRQWGVGAQGEAGDPAKNLGVVVLLVPLQDHKPGTGHVFIATGRGAEGFLPDARVGRVRDAMVPFLVREESGRGLAVGVDLIAQAFANEFGVTLDSVVQRAVPPRRDEDQPRIPILWVVIFVVFLVAISRGRIFLLPFLLSSMAGSRSGRGGWGRGGRGGRGGWGGGGGGGGFGGFGGGGGFSGGGAGGRF